MYQRCFDNASETLFVAGKTPRLSGDAANLLI